MAGTTASVSSLRRTAFALLLVVAAGLTAAAILAAPPAFSVNDQSRWATIRALGDTGSYSIGRRYPRADGTYEDRGIRTEAGWWTVDVVMRPDTQRFYSTKPTLLPTLLAGEYWLLRRAVGWQITRNRVAVGRVILFTINWLPFVLYLVLLAWLAEQLGTTEWGRLFVFATGCFGTFVSGFLVTLNNHTVAACGALFAVYQCVQIATEREPRRWRFVLAGLFAGWTMVNELPAAALAAALLLWLVLRSPRAALCFALPALLLPVAAYLFTQYLAFGSIVPTYARTEWYLFDGSYWRNPTGVDRASDGKLLYGFNLLAGHTGILSLTPVLLVGWIGMIRGAKRSPGAGAGTIGRDLTWLTLSLTVVTLVFYTVRTNNYGGVAAGLRWFFWLTPLWLLTMLPEADRWSQRRWARGIAYALLAISVGSAAYALVNPWRHSWLYDLLRNLGVISYR